MAPAGRPLRHAGAILAALIYASQIPRTGSSAAVLARLSLGKALPLMARPVREQVSSSPRPH